MKYLLRFSAAVLMLAFSAALVFAGPASALDEIQPAKITFTTIDVPGAMATNVTGINNNGELVGGYTTDGKNGLGFTYVGSNFSYFSYPGANIVTEVGGVNDSGVIAGTAANTQTLTSVAFLYNGSTFTTLKLSSRSDPYGDGVNNAGDVVGGIGVEGAGQCYELVGAKLKNVTPPPGSGFILAYATGINNLGEITGWTTATSTTSFLYKGGQFRTVIVPGAVDYTEAWGINDSGTVVGWYGTSCCTSGFLLIKGKYVSLNYPGASSTYPLGINNAGEVVGAYMLGGVTHGFVTSPVTAADLD